MWIDSNRKVIEEAQRYCVTTRGRVSVIRWANSFFDDATVDVVPNNLIEVLLMFRRSYLRSLVFFGLGIVVILLGLGLPDI